MAEPKTPALAVAPEALTAPGLVIRHTVNLGEEARTLQFETFVDRDSQLSEINHLCDAMRKASDRQRALHVLPSYRRNMEDAVYKQNEKIMQVAAIRTELAEMDEVRAEKRRELEVRRDADLSRAEAEHYGTGRRTPFKPRAATTRVEDADMALLDANEKRAHDEAQGKILTLEAQIKTEGREIFMWDKLIAEHEALARDVPANDG